MFQVDRKQQVVILLIAAVLIFIAGYRVSRWQGGQYREPGGADVPVQAAKGEGGREIVVHISGAVEKPGVYKFAREARVMDALEKAGPLERADIQGLNLAAPLKDGQKIVVPLKQDAQAGTGLQKGGPAPSPGGVESPQGGAGLGTAAKININRAGARELEELPGVGPGLARRIVNHREVNGLFASEEDIKGVQGIGEKLYGQIKDLITVN